MKTYRVIYSNGTCANFQVSREGYGNFQAWCLSIGADWEEVK